MTIYDVYSIYGINMCIRTYVVSVQIVCTVYTYTVHIPYSGSIVSTLTHSKPCTGLRVIILIDILRESTTILIITNITSTIIISANFIVSSRDRTTTCMWRRREVIVGGCRVLTEGIISLK